MKKNFYDPKNILGKNQRSIINEEDFVKEDRSKPFKIGQIYEDHPASTLVCLHCGNSEFNVGTGDFYTAIRCTTCMYELCVHEG